MSMWDKIELKTEGDVHHYMNNALSVITIDIANIQHHVKDNPEIEWALARIQTSVDNLTLFRDAVIEQLICTNTTTK